jgi:hypothetical protein
MPPPGLSELLYCNSMLRETVKSVMPMFRGRKALLWCIYLVPRRWAFVGLLMSEPMFLGPMFLGPMSIGNVFR